MNKVFWAGLLKKILDCILLSELFTVSSPIAFQEETPEIFYERLAKNDCKESN